MIKKKKKKYILYIEKNISLKKDSEAFMDHEYEYIRIDDKSFLF